MKQLVFALAVVVAAIACGSAQKSEPHNREQPHNEQPQLDMLPAEVTKLVDRWTNCWHFAGEEGTDAARRNEIESGISEWCPGNEQERARLQTKYRDRADVQDALKKLDEMQ